MLAGGSSNDIHNEYGESKSGGVKVMGIQGRMARLRERQIGMTEEERIWRAKWVKDQELHDEPVVPPNFYKERYNPIRRFYRFPMDQLEKALTPYFGHTGATATRHVIAKGAFILLGIYSAFYWIKYNPGDWTRKSGWKMTMNRIPVFPGDPNYPNYKDKTAQEFATYGFENSPI